MLRFVLLSTFALLASFPAMADPNTPEIAKQALAYRQTLEAAPKSAKLGALLSGIRQAQSLGAVGETLHLYEQLVALEPNNFRSWLKLGLTWHEADKGAAGGLNAAWNAYENAHGAPDQVEALLLMSAVLRDQLAAAREAYQTNSRDLAGVTEVLRGEDACPNADAPRDSAAVAASRVALNCKTRDDYAEAMRRASARVGEIAHDLDEIYAEISSKLPGLVDVQKMKQGDNRALDFAPISISDSSQVKVAFKMEGDRAKGCVEFTQDLNADASAYNNFVSLSFLRDTHKQQDNDDEAGEAKPQNSPTPMKASLSTQGRTLCIDNLTPGANYSLVLKKGLRSKLGLELASDAAETEVDAPDIPARVQFSGGRFVLPRSGAGKIEAQTTNLHRFNAELYRITDRTLYRQIALGYVGGADDNLPGDEYQGLSEHFGELMWRGAVVMPTRGKPNESVSALLPVRDLLNRRREWIRQRSADNKRASQEILASGARNDFVANETEPGLPGEFFADSSDFEAAAGALANPGVYALVTPDPGSDCRDGKTVAEHKPCDQVVQWFIDTDIGLTFYEGSDKFDVVLRSLETGEALHGVVQLVTAGNRVLGELATDANGVARFPKSLTRGTQSNALAAIMAQVDSDKGLGDFAFMTFNSERLDLSKLNVDGRTLPAGVDAFLTTDRGLYEPGQTIELVALLRDAKGEAIEAPPRAMVRLEARDRVLIQAPIEPSEWKLGGARKSIVLPKEARSGPVRVVLSLGEGENAAVGETLIHIGPIKPDQVDVQFPDAGSTWSARADHGKLEVKGPIVARYLFAAQTDKLGAARDLRVEAVARVSAGETPKEACYRGFAFGKYDESPITGASVPSVQFTDGNGDATLDLAGFDIPVATRPIAATIEVMVYDSSGPVGGRSLALPVNDGKGWIGLAKAPSLHTDRASGKASLDLDVVRLTADNQPDGDHALEASLWRERESYSWEVHDGGTPQYTRSISLEPTPFQRSFSASQLQRATGSAASAGAEECVQPERMTNLFENLDVGRYVLTVEDKDTGRIASTRIQVGAAQTDPDELEPNIFVLSSDKELYQPDETIELTAQTPFDGPVLVALAQGDVEHWVAGRAENGVAKLRFSPPADWAGKGFYALATVFRAGDKSISNAGPDRAIGAKYVEISGKPKGFAASVAILSRGEFKPLAPGEDLKFRLCVSASPQADCAQDAPAMGGGVGEDVFAVAYVVDEGLIGLTGHHSPPPDPQAHFYGRRRLDVRLMDTYSRLLLTAGGDRPGRLALSNYTSESVVAAAMGPVKLQGGRAEFSFPNLGLANGRLSIFVIAWSKSFAASASSQVTVHSPVVFDLGAPRFLLAGDRAIIPLRMVNFDFAHDGDFAIRASVDGTPGRVAFQPEAGDKAAESAELRTPLRLGETKIVYLVVEPEAASSGAMVVSLDVEPVGSPIPLPGRKRTWRIDVRPPRLSSVATLSFPLQSNPTPISKLVGDLVAGYADPRHVRVTAHFADSAQSLLSVAAPAAPTGATHALDQLALRAMTYFGDRVRAQDPAARPEGERLLGDILSLQLPDGSFLNYRTVGNPTDLEMNQDKSPDGLRSALRRTAVALEAFSLAKAAGYAVPASSVAAARQFAVMTRDDNEPDIGCSFEALLADFALVDFGAVDEDRIEKIAACPNHEIWEKAAAYAVASRFGSTDKAQVILTSFATDAKEGALNNLGDSEAGQIKLAMMANFLAQAKAPAPAREPVADALLTTGNRVLSPTAAAWIAGDADLARRSSLDLAAIHIEGDGLGALSVGPNGVLETESVNFERLQNSPTLVSVGGDQKARAFVTIEGVPASAKGEDTLPAGAIRRRVYSAADGHEINLKTDELKIGDRLVIVIEGDRNPLAKAIGADGDAEPQDIDEPFVVADLLPSALKIAAPTVQDAKEFKTAEWIKKLGPIGDLRSIDSDPDRWVALVVPRSRQPPPPEAPDSQNPSAPPKPAATGATPDANVDFRQAYVARVNLGGRFLWPGVSIEASTQFATTYRSESSTFEVKALGAQAK